MEEECIHGLGDPAWCTICNGRKAREDAMKWNIEYVFQAKFDSVCDNCSTGILEGDTIAKTSGGLYVCSTCTTF